MTETPQENTAAPTENQPAENYPAAESLPVRQRAVVATDRPARYIKQLGSHMGRKLGTAELPDGLRLTFNRDGISAATVTCAKPTAHSSWRYAPKTTSWLLVWRMCWTATWSASVSARNWS